MSVDVSSGPESRTGSTVSAGSLPDVQLAIELHPLGVHDLDREHGLPAVVSPRNQPVALKLIGADRDRRSAPPLRDSKRR